MYVYYRATSLKEAKALSEGYQLASDKGVTYWTDGIQPARLYQGASRVIVRLTTSKPVPECYMSVAQQYNVVRNHREWCVPKNYFNKFLAAYAEKVEVL